MEFVLNQVDDFSIVVDDDRIDPTIRRLSYGSLGGVDVLVDMLRRSLFDPEEIERERTVVLQEISEIEDTPDDYVIATGETHTVQELVEIAFERAGLDWKRHVKLDKAFLRPAEVDLLIGDPSKAEKKLGWKPTVSFQEMIHMMVDADIERLSSGR